MFADKDIAGVAAAMQPRVDRWFIAALPGARGAGADVVRDALVAAGVDASAVRTFAGRRRRVRGGAGSRGRG